MQDTIHRDRKLVLALAFVCTSIALLGSASESKANYIKFCNPASTVWVTLAPGANCTGPLVSLRYSQSEPRIYPGNRTCAGAVTSSGSFFGSYICGTGSTVTSIYGGISGNNPGCICQLRPRIHNGSSKNLQMTGAYGNN